MKKGEWNGEIGQGRDIAEGVGGALQRVWEELCGMDEEWRREVARRGRSEPETHTLALTPFFVPQGGLEEEQEERAVRGEAGG
jgi:hypothetical protein